VNDAFWKSGKHRQPRQCRERWFNHLDPSLLKCDWTMEEELMLIEQWEVYGNKWA
jgi:myb proto-oncogene protein